jgi:cysteine sulfinate desulfinase/cysteine desulfurase-like protein
MAVPDELALCTLRLTVGRPTTAEEIDTALAEISRVARTMCDGS